MCLQVRHTLSARTRCLPHHLEIYRRPGDRSGQCGARRGRARATAAASTRGSRTGARRAGSRKGATIAVARLQTELLLVCSCVRCRSAEAGRGPRSTAVRDLTEKWTQDFSHFTFASVQAAEDAATLLTAATAVAESLLVPQRTELQYL